MKVSLKKEVVQYMESSKQPQEVADCWSCASNVAGTCSVAVPRSCGPAASCVAW